MIKWPFELFSNHRALKQCHIRIDQALLQKGSWCGDNLPIATIVQGFFSLLVLGSVDHAVILVANTLNQIHSFYTQIINEWIPKIIKTHRPWICLSISYFKKKWHHNIYNIYIYFVFSR